VGVSYTFSNYHGHEAKMTSMDHGSVNPFRDWATVMDCGDISNTPFDKLVAIHELEKGMKAMNAMKPKNESSGDAVRFITIGGDHTISRHFLPYFRFKTYGE
jgi:arginase family enzyme